MPLSNKISNFNYSKDIVTDEKKPPCGHLTRLKIAEKSPPNEKPIIFLKGRPHGIYQKLLYPMSGIKRRLVRIGMPFIVDQLNHSWPGVKKDNYRSRWNRNTKSITVAFELN